MDNFLKAITFHKGHKVNSWLLKWTFLKLLSTLVFPHLALEIVIYGLFFFFFKPDFKSWLNNLSMSLATPPLLVSRSNSPSTRKKHPILPGTVQLDEPWSSLLLFKWGQRSHLRVAVKMINDASKLLDSTLSMYGSYHYCFPRLIPPHALECKSTMIQAMFYLPV